MCEPHSSLKFMVYDERWKEGYLGVQISCHYVVLLIKLLKDHFSHLQVPMSTVGYDICEVFLSKVGVMIQNERTYDGCDLVESVDDLTNYNEPNGPL